MSGFAGTGARSKIESGGLQFAITPELPVPSSLTFRGLGAMAENIVVLPPTGEPRWIAVTMEVSPVVRKLRAGGKRGKTLSFNQKSRADALSSGSVLSQDKE